MYNLDINKGDTILRGKYRNKKEVVKTFGHDEKGQPTINGKRILNFNIEKLLPKKDIKEMKRSELKELIMECILEEGSGKNPRNEIKAIISALKKLGQGGYGDDSKIIKKRILQLTSELEGSWKGIGK